MMAGKSKPDRACFKIEEADEVFFHNMEMSGSRDANIKAVLEGRISLIDALTFAGQGTKYVKESIQQSLLDNLGLHEYTGEPWTPEKEKEMRGVLGLSEEAPDIKDLAAFKEDFKKEAFGANLKKKQWNQLWIKRLNRVIL